MNTVEHVKKWSLRASALVLLSLVGLMVAVGGGIAGWFIGQGGFNGLQQNKTHGELRLEVAGQRLLNDAVEATVELPAGLLTFQASSPDPAGYTMLLVKMPAGKTITDYLSGLAGMANTGVQDTETAKQYHDANYGGARVAGDKCKVSFTVVLQPGTYYIIAFWGAGVSDTHPRTQELKVTGDAGNVTLPDTPHKVTLEEGNNPPRFVTDDEWPADGRILVDNETSVPSETVFLPLSPDATDDDLYKFFHHDGAEPNWLSTPFSEIRVCGMAPTSPGHKVLVHVSSPPGEYVLASFVFNPKYNKRQYQLGMYKRIKLSPMA
ncbi:hypothetical protein ONA70_09725 [Micromonospora yasonensis]|uniref:hypothetical protein n=1 Tax=Micromonospora yasonensis TaxID=1128667 RepID=UPI00222F7BFC|nr:hypothetical protein [Micromonospora yasonensis]MCW3840373.1 hypothetical protein [Micromonospora yasonensis]